ncbi:MAG: UTRA domain-containing protein [Chloroflexi bacterium]|nr:MAG: UTRA domain-containing protein [Chloroflexota bacterium]
MTVAADELLARLTEIRATDPEAVRRALAKRQRRPLLQRGSLFLIAADHPARGVLKVGADPMAMADRGELLRRLLTASGIHLRLASQSIGARSAQPREARLLKVIRSAPLLTMRRISYGDAGQPVEYGSHVYPAERYSFEMSVVADSRT